MKHPNFRHRRAARGIALIEVLVGMLIFSIGILGLVGLQVAMTRAQGSAKFRADAAYLTSEAVGAMWADTTNLGSYVTAPGAACTYQRCADWVNKVTTGLPSGAATVAVAGTDVSMTVTWSTTSEGTRSYVLATTIVR